MIVTALAWQSKPQRIAVLALAAGLLCAHPAKAEPAGATSDGASAYEVVPDENSLDWTVLMHSAESGEPAARNPRSSASVAAPAPRWKRNKNPDGSAAVTVDRTLVKEWDGKIGADFSLAPPPTTTTGSIDPERLLPGAVPATSTGTAWVSATAPALDLPLSWDKALVVARLDPAHDQGTIGLSIAKSVPLGRKLALSLQSGVSVQEPLASSVGTAPLARSYSFDPSMRLTIAQTKTSFAVGATRSTLDDRWLHRLGAEQMLFGHVNIAGAISETTTGQYDKSIVARLKRTW